MRGDSQLSSGAQAIVKFTRRQTTPGQAANFSPCTYLTSDNFLDSITANGYLSTTYFPRFRNSFEIDSSINQLYNNQRDPIGEPFVTSSPRVWPAFGRWGGGHETIILENAPPRGLSSIRAIGSRIEFPDGGETESYHQDDVADYDPALAKAIAESLYNAVGGSIPVEDEAVLSGKINESGFVTVDAFRARPNRHYTVSIAHKILPSQWGLKLWGYLWYDESGVRRIYGPLEDSFVASDLWDPQMSEEKIKRLLRGLSPSSYPLSDVSEIAKQVLIRLRKVTDPFFETYSRLNLILPP